LRFAARRTDAAAGRVGIPRPIGPDLAFFIAVANVRDRRGGRWDCFRAPLDAMSFLFSFRGCPSFWRAIARDRL
jgi:hypothetical protein